MMEYKWEDESYIGEDRCLVVKINQARNYYAGRDNERFRSLFPHGSRLTVIGLIVYAGSDGVRVKPYETDKDTHYGYAFAWEEIEKIL